MLDLRVMDTVDDIVNKSVIAGDPLPALDFGKQLKDQAQVSGVAMAKLLFGVRKNWELYQAAGIDDYFEDVAADRTGLSTQTITKYVNMWESVFENRNISDVFKEHLMAKSVGQLLLLTAFAREGVEDDVMKRVVAAPDVNSLREIIKEKNGERTSASTAIHLCIQVREGGRKLPGTVYARRGSEEIILGELKNPTGSELGEMALNRIIESARIKEIL